jgi:hypothetical protein
MSYRHLCIKFRVGRSSDILRSVGILRDLFVGRKRKVSEEAGKSCKCLRSRDIIRVSKSVRVEYNGMNLYCVLEESENNKNIAPKSEGNILPSRPRQR